MDLSFLKRQRDKKVSRVEKKGLKLIVKKCLTGEIVLLSKTTRYPRCESWLYSLPDLENCECSSWIHFTSFASAHKSIKYILFHHMPYLLSYAKKLNFFKYKCLFCF